MRYAELIERLQALPHDKQVEVFGYVDFLSHRVGIEETGPRAHIDWSDADFANLAKKQALHGIEDDPVACTANDLRERWQ